MQMSSERVNLPASWDAPAFWLTILDATAIEDT